MSLLLDALKKAAEHKAAKEAAIATQADTETVSTSDETIVLDDTRTVIDNTVAFDEDPTEYQQEDTIALAKPDNSESEGKAEVAGVDSTESTQIEEDATEILDDEDVTEFLGDYDATQIVEQQVSDDQNDSDIDKTALDYEEDATQLDLTQALGSEKIVDNMGIIDEAYLSRMKKSSAEELTDDDVTEFMGEYDSPVNASVFGQSADVQDTDVALEPTVLEGSQQNEDLAESEDMSLTLIKVGDATAPQSQLNDATATQVTDSLITNSQITDAQLSDLELTDLQITDSQITDGEVQILAQHSQTTEGLHLVDIAEADTAHNDTVTKRSVDFSGLTNEETLTRHDSTSTRTYAPDNYDRTLVKIDQDDASKLFAGMKSESDVLMTPDYAKKVFISNSSVQRFNSYKIYFGAAAVILLVILIFGLFEYEEQSINIDNSLRALKRDPMPILPKRSVVQEQTNLFAKTGNAEGVSTQTLALVENAGESPELAPQTTEVIVDDAQVSGTINSGDVAADDTEAEISEAQVLDVVQNNTDYNKVAAAVKAKPATQGPAQTAQQNDTTSLQLSSKHSITKKDELLKDAYAAYQLGDNNTALEKYNRVLVFDPQNRNALLARAAISVQNDNSAAAIEDYQTLLLANPKDSLAMSSLMSVANISPLKSESQLKGMIRDEPSSPHLNFALANVYGAQNRWQEAQGLYFKALENNPNDPNYAYNLAVSLEHISKPKVAITYYQRALVNFNNGLATFNKAVVDQRVEILKQ